MLSERVNDGLYYDHLMRLLCEYCGAVMQHRKPSRLKGRVFCDHECYVRYVKKFGVWWLQSGAVKAT